MYVAGGCCSLYPVRVASPSLCALLACCQQARKAAKSKRHRQNEATRRLVERINPGLGNKYAKQDMMKELGRAKNVTKTVAAGADSTGSSAFKSAKFFAKLQDQVASEVAGFRGKKEEKKSATGSAAAFKL